jgi:hypothetical protein
MEHDTWFARRQAAVQHRAQVGRVSGQDRWRIGRNAVERRGEQVRVAVSVVTGPTVTGRTASLRGGSEEIMRAGAVHGSILVRLVIMVRWRAAPLVAVIP